MNGDSGQDAKMAGELFAEAVAIMGRLRGPGGCPWDREQSFESIRKYTLEETYEVLDAIDRGNWSDLKEELGDLLLQVLFYSEMATEPGYFSIADVLEGLNRKLVRRHPHVFGDQAAIAAGNAVHEGLKTSNIDADQVLRNWEQIKRAEKPQSEGAATSLLDGVPRNFPALMEASKLGSKATKVGFDWPEADGVFAKLEEEIEELREAVELQKTRIDAANPELTEEVGDLLFTVVNLSRRLGVDPELALRQTNRKFRRRFAFMESSASGPLQQQSALELEELWAGAKLAERPLSSPEAAQ